MANKKNSTVETVFKIVEPIAEKMQLDIWDIRFEKEGPNWFLKIFIDKKDGVNINDCENFSRNIDPLIDEIDPIEHSYFLEVSSPGIERELTRDWHIKKYIGSIINIKFIRNVNGYKNLEARLINFDGDILTVLLNDGLEMSFNKKEAAYIKLPFSVKEDF
mgnify:CR=1 FL=1